MARLTRIGVGGVVQTYGTITDKSSGNAPRPGTIFTRIGVGGVGATLGTITDKSAGLDPRPGTLFTRIGVGGVGITFGTITDKAGTEQIARTGSMLASLIVRRRMARSRR